MKGLTFLFLSIVFSGIGLRYCSPKTRRTILTIIKDNLVVIILATLAIAVAVSFSVNTTLRLV